MSHTHTSPAVGFRAAREYNATVKPNSDVLDALRSAVPHCFDADGTFRRDIFDAELNAGNVQETRDGYRLNFIGKDYARLQSGQRSETLLIPDTTHNTETENADSGNIFITGDNLEALRHLANAYKGQVKVIYIDPPYNTGKEFVYSDKFEWKDETLKELLGYSDDDIKRLHTINARSSHSAWLTFMYPRLKLAYKLLAKDGVIFVSIDDNEQANLKLLMDEIFGEGNCIADLIWESKYTVSNDAQFVSSQHETVLFYARNKTCFEIGKLERTEDQNQSYKNPDKDPKGRWKPTPIHAKDENERTKIPITFANGVVWTCPSGRHPIYSTEKFLELEKNGEMYFNPSGGVDKKTYLKDVETKGIVPGSILYYENRRSNGNNKELTQKPVYRHTLGVGHTHENNEELAGLLGKGIFDNPKGTRLIQRLIHLGNAQKDDIIFDFFAGSGTTAHAVMQLNAEDGGQRRWILAQKDEETKKDSEARQKGFNTIDEIARKRITLAAEKIWELNPMFAGDLGFRHYRIKPLDVESLDKIEAFDPAALQQADMFEDMASKIGVDAILTTWMVADGYMLTDNVQKIEIAGYTAHYLDNSLLYIIAGGWGSEQTQALLNLVGERKLNLNTIIVFGYSFGLESMRELEISIKTSLNNEVQIEKRY